MKLASELGVVIPNPWVTWFKGALVPSLLGLLITPLLMFKVGCAILTCSSIMFPQIMQLEHFLM